MCLYIWVQQYYAFLIYKLNKLHLLILLYVVQGMDYRVCQIYVYNVS